MNNNNGQLPRILTKEEREERRQSHIMKAVMKQQKIIPKEPIDLDALAAVTAENVPSPFTVVEEVPKSSTKRTVEEALKAPQSSPLQEELNDLTGFDYSNLLNRKWTFFSISKNLKDLLGSLFKFFNQILSSLNSIKSTIDSLEPTKKQYQKLDADFKVLKEQYDISERNLQVCNQRFNEFSELFREFRALNPVLHEKNKQWFELVEEKINSDLNVE